MTLYVGNINFAMTEDELKEVFAEYGNVSSVKIIRDKFSGRSRGYGFVEIDDAGDAEKAVAELNGKSVQEREIKVNEAYPRRDDDSSAPADSSSSTTPEAPAEDAPAEEAPAEEAPAEETSAEETPAEETPAEDAAVEETPADEAPAEKTPAEGAPTEEAPAEEASADDSGESSEEST